jgi:hypothetical protein
MATAVSPRPRATTKPAPRDRHRRADAFVSFGVRLLVVAQRSEATEAQQISMDMFADEGGKGTWGPAGGDRLLAGPDRWHEPSVAS